MDMMAIRRGILAAMVSGVNFPSSVEVKTFTLDADATGSSNVTIPNPFGRVDMAHILCINFADTPSTGKCVGFLCNPSAGFADDNGNRKIVESSGTRQFAQFYAIVAMTATEITLRNSGILNYGAGTYYMFAW